MRKTLIFLFTLSLSLSATIPKYRITFKHIIDDLDKLKNLTGESVSPPKYKQWNCSHTVEAFTQLKGALNNVTVPSQSVLKTLIENLEEIDVLLKKQNVTGSTTCPIKRRPKTHLENYWHVLRCLYRNCTVTSMKS